MFISVLTHITYLYAHVRNTDPLYLALASRIRPAARYVRSTMGCVRSLWMVRYDHLCHMIVRSW